MAIGKISTETVHRAVPQQLLSFLLLLSFPVFQCKVGVSG